MPEKLVHLTLTIIIMVGMYFPSSNQLNAKDFELPLKIIVTPEMIETQTRFSEKLSEKKNILGYKTIREVDPEIDACSEEQIKQAGKEGERRTYTKVVYYDGEKYSEEIDKTEVINPLNQIVVKGGKKVYKTLDTPNGQIQYWCKMERFLATAYDSTCPGCDMITAIGMKQGFGVIAVDPKVIPLRSRVYVPGYGEAVAGDTGGMINGKHIDLGYDSLTGQWSRAFVDVYLL